MGKKTICVALMHNSMRMWSTTLLMGKGANWLLHLPPELVQGENGAIANGIMPNETLICDFELDYIDPPKN